MTAPTHKTKSPPRDPYALVDSVQCPSCWHRFKPHDFHWVAANPACKGDPLAGPEAQLRFPPQRFTSDCRAIDPEGWPCDELACPRCHVIMPRSFASERTITLSIVGVPRCSKTYFLVTSSGLLKATSRKEFGITFNDADTVANEVLTEYVSKLFNPANPDDIASLPKTEVVSNHHYKTFLDDRPVRLVRPLFFDLQAKAATAGQGALVCLYDNAGEDFLTGADDASQPVTRHVAIADALFYVYDPLQCAKFRDRLRRGGGSDPQLDPAWSISRDPQSTCLTHVAQRIRKIAGLADRARVRKPLIVVVSKSDVWRALIDGEDLETEPVLPASGGAGTKELDAARIARVSGKVRALLEEMDPAFVSAAESISEHVVYIPVSPLGRSPEIHGASGVLGIQPKDLHPRWVTIPFLYALTRITRGLVAVAGGPR